MHRFAVLLAVLCPMFLFTLAPAEESAAPAEANIQETVSALVKALNENKGTVRVGMAMADADRAQPGAAKHIHNRYMPLRGSWLDKARRLDGVVDWDKDLATGKKVDSIRVVLVTGRFDRKKVGKAVAEAARAIGLDMTPDSEDPDTWFDASGVGGIDVWVSFGDDVVLLEAEGD